MRNGKYIVDSIEGSLVKLLYSDDESIEEVISIDQFIHPVKQGDILGIIVEDEKIISVTLESETKSRREQAERLIEKLKNKNK